MGRVTRRHPVLRLGPDQAVHRSDTLAVEEPLEIRLDGAAFLVTMRTPGDDVDLVHGLLHSEGIVAAVDDILAARYCEGAGPDGLNTYNVLDVTLGPQARPPSPDQRRQVATTSACGVCGTTSIDQVVRQSCHPLSSDLRVPVEVISAAPDRLREQQRAFAKTGGLHAAGLMTADGVLLCVREDVGRHNAVDKVVGARVLAGASPAAPMLCVSGRIGFEIVQKAVVAEIGVLAAVGAPSSLAVQLAERAGLCTAGFVRGGRFVVYSAPDRVGV